MDRGAWQTLVHGVTRVGHYLVTKQQQVINYSDHGVYHVCMTYLYWKFVPLDSLNLFPYPPTPTPIPATTNPFSVLMSLIFVCFVGFFFIPVK